MATVVVVPTYNESDNIETLVAELLSLPVHPLYIVIVDDNSPDGTGVIADSLARMHPQVRVIHRPHKLGLGTAHIAGMKEGLKLGAERVLTMDADFSHKPSYIPELISRSRHYHLVIGSRYVPGGGSLHCGLKRRALSRTANAFARLALGLEAHDCTAGFRLYRRGVLERIGLDNIFSNGYSFLIEMLYKCQQQGHRAGEVPIIFEDRRRGFSKISRQEIFLATYTVFRLFFHRLLGVLPIQAGQREREKFWNK
jgi:dolichol-phosphate mannosyltransferase